MGRIKFKTGREIFLTINTYVTNNDAIIIFHIILA